MSSKNKKNYKNENDIKKSNIRWVLIITLWTFILSISVSIVSESILRNFDIILAFISLIIVIIFGVFFDIIGIAVTASDEKTFHSMAANKIKEAKYAVKLVRNAGRVSNFCNDVIGDICGIISGAAGTIIVMKLVSEYGFSRITLISVVMTGIIASLTVGGKAIGKEFAINKSDKIIFFTAKIVMILDTKLRIDVLPELRSYKNK
ncbi:CNNM domain-containing protein [Proteiniborus sp.]|uniref:CNNM domain-containing protein n=1 Tax=Proteiniborus sp. TaxID=2079015 RepID=UPI00332ADA2F